MALLVIIAMICLSTFCFVAKYEILNKQLSFQVHGPMTLDKFPCFIVVVVL